MYAPGLSFTAERFLRSTLPPCLMVMAFLRTLTFLAVLRFGFTSAVPYQSIDLFEIFLIVTGLGAAWAGAATSVALAPTARAARRPRMVRRMSDAFPR